jgi:hypothetical protein
MEMDYLLTPSGLGNRFDERVLSLMRGYWDKAPFYVRGDGAYIICRNKEVLEDVRKYQEEERPNTSSTAIIFRPENVLMSSMGWIDLDAQLADFVEWCQQRWPCELFLATGDPATAAILRHD